MDEPLPREIYRHFKGGTYEIVAIARDCDNLDRKFVIYKSRYGVDFPEGTIFSRSLEDFVGEKEINGKKVKRFTKIG